MLADTQTLRFADFVFVEAVGRKPDGPNQPQHSPIFDIGCQKNISAVVAPPIRLTFFVSQKHQNWDSGEICKKVIMND